MSVTTRPVRKPGKRLREHRFWCGTPTTWSVCCYTRQQAEQVKARLAAWLAPRGLVFNEDKTRIVHLEEGFNFLGFNLRRYRRKDQPAKLLITPSQDAVRRIRHRLADETRRMRGSNAMALIARLNPIIRGWAAYYRGVVSSKLFGALDHYVWWLTYRWACRSHPRKPKKWIVHRYFGRFNRFRNDRWVFGAADPALAALAGPIEARDRQVDALERGLLGRSVESGLSSSC